MGSTELQFTKLLSGVQRAERGQYIVMKAFGQMANRDCFFGDTVPEMTTRLSVAARLCLRHLLPVHLLNSRLSRAKHEKSKRLFIHTTHLFCQMYAAAVQAYKE